MPILLFPCPDFLFNCEDRSSRQPKGKQDLCYCIHIAFSSHLPEPKKSPFFDIKPVSIDVIAGESADFECHVTGAQPMRITWSKDNKEIRPGGNYTITCVGNTPHLRILKVGKGDSGQYTCQATNDVGKDMCSAQLSVKGTTA